MLSNDAKVTTFAMTDTKLYVPVVNLSTQDNAKLFEQLRYGFKRKIKWNKYQPIVSTENQNLNCLIDLGVNRLVVLLFENANDKK